VEDAELTIENGLVEHLSYLLRGGGAHLSLGDAVADWPVELRGREAADVPYTAWQILEHVRIAQWDILGFCRNRDHVSPEFPGGYWPREKAPPDSEAWPRSLGAIQSDLESFLKLVSERRATLLEPIPHGQGQTLLREALLVADHNSYHLGQLILVRRLLGRESAGQ
jgi:hypothetical protein